jgi:hypothetical protein
MEPLVDRSAGPLSLTVAVAVIGDPPALMTFTLIVPVGGAGSPPVKESPLSVSHPQVAKARTAITRVNIVGAFIDPFLIQARVRIQRLASLCVTMAA